MHPDEIIVDEEEISEANEDDEYEEDDLELNKA